MKIIVIKMLLGAGATGGVVRQVVQSVQPIVQSVVRQETLTSSASNDGDLVARIISQLTPYIQVIGSIHE